MLDDRKLWDDFRANKKYALSHIYYQHIDLLYRYGMKFSSDGEFIKDTIQELFFDLIRTRSKLGSTDSIRFYLFKALRQKIFRELKRNKKKADYISAGNFDDSGLGISISHEEELIDDEINFRRDSLIQKGIEKLSPKQQEILYYRYVCEFDYPQICDLMSIKYDSARKMVYRAISSLREDLNKSDVNS